MNNVHIHHNSVTKVRGEYKFIRRKGIPGPDGELIAGPIVEETPWCKNKMTLYYFNTALTTGGVRPGRCVVGTGNSTPLETQLTLDSYLAKTQTIQAGPTTTRNATVSPRYVRKEWTFRFAAGVATGNISEAGIIHDLISFGAINGSTSILSRCLVVDGSGTPTTITILSDEFLDVVWRCTWYVPEDTTGTFNMTIDGVVTAFNYTVRAVRMAPLSNDNWEGPAIGMNGPVIVTDPVNYSSYAYATAHTDTTLVGYTASPSGPNAQNIFDSITAASYVSDSKQRSWTLSASLNRANIAISTIFLPFSTNSSGNQGMGAYQVLLSAPVNKVSTKLFSFTFNLSLANAD